MSTWRVHVARLRIFGTPARRSLLLRAIAFGLATYMANPSLGDDCNGNLIDDACDIDCNAPGCLPSADCGGSNDCNENGLPDECELDCNCNDISDECEIADNPLLDCDGDGLLSECEPDVDQQDCDLDGLCNGDDGAHCAPQYPTGAPVVLKTEHQIESVPSPLSAGGSELEFCVAAKLTASDGAAEDYFGGSVSISGDLAVIGAFWDDDNGSRSGSAYVIRWNGSNWVQEQKLLPDDGATDDLFGSSVSVSGDVAVIGAALDDDNGTDSGSAYVFRWNGSNWVQEQKLLPDDGAAPDFFGNSVSVSGDVALIGAPLDDDNGIFSGSAYVFRYNGTNWVQEQKLLAEDRADNDWFGDSVAVSGDVAVIGAWQDDDNGDRSGSAYVFRWNGATWVQEQKLLPDDGAADDWFGFSVSVSGDVAVIGASHDDNNGSDSGSAYVFRWNETSWVQEQKLLPDDGAASDHFGGSVSVSGYMAVIGASWDDDNGEKSGSAYVFRWNGTAWVQEQKLLPDDGAADDRFGVSVSVSGDVPVIGAYRDDDNGSDSGSAYIFLGVGEDCNVNGVFDACDIANGTSQDSDGDGIPDICTDLCVTGKLLADDGAIGDEFGISVSTSGEVAVIGAWFDDDNGDRSGSAYVFRWNGTAWVQEQKLLPDDGAGFDWFGVSVSVSGDVAVIGAPWHEDNFRLSGSAYVFRYNGATWVQEQELLPDDGADLDRFGESVSVSGDLAVIGALDDDDDGTVSGSAYVFRWNGTSWVQEQKLLPDDGADYDMFGHSVSVSGEVAVIGAWLDDDNGDASGSAYAFRWNGASWEQEAKLLPDDGTSDDEFGESVSVSGDLAVIGVHGDDDNGSDSGSAYVFRWNGTSWVQEQKLLPDDGAANAHFGRSVSVAGDGAVIGANGSAYVFRWNGTSWAQEQKLLAHDGGGGFGGSVSVSGDARVIGASQDDDNGGASGSAYVFSGPGVDDCNQNDVFDACDIGTGRSGDCNENGIPDDCEFPQVGLVESKWVAEEPGLWSNEQNWCLQEVPDNNGQTMFDVLIDGSDAIATLDISPTITDLTLSNEATLQVDEQSGASPRTLAVGEEVQSTGVFRATDGFRMVLDTPAIDQTGGGVLQADDDGTLPPGDKSVLQINGGIVTGGVARVLGCQSAIELIGAAELRDVNIIGDCDGGAVVVPDSRIAKLGGTVDNTAQIRVAAETNATFLQVGDVNVSVIGTGSIVLENEDLAILGLFGRTMTNEADHTVEGAGIVFGGFVNNGIVDANVPGKELRIRGIGAKTNNGIMRASAGGILDIQWAIQRDGDSGELRADGGNVRISDPKGIGFRAEFERVFVACVPGGEIGELSVGGMASLVVSEDLVIDMTGESPLLGGCVPPPPRDPLTQLQLTDDAILDVSGTIRFIGEVGVEIGPNTNVLLAGDFDNQSDVRASTDFKWADGMLRLNGDGSEPFQQFELAGEDRGPVMGSFVDNFAMGTLEVAADAGVDFEDIFDNQLDGPDPCEVLYVHTLVLGSGSTIVLHGCNIYYEFLDDQGATIDTELGGKLVQVLPGDYDGNGSVDLIDFGFFQVCFEVQPLDPPCATFDFNGDDIVNLDDYASFQSEFTGP